MIVTDATLQPSHRYCLVLLDKLAKDGFVLKQKKFVRNFTHGKQVINLSFISTAGLIYGVEFYYDIVFESAEKMFKKLFGKHWADWTVHEQVGTLYNNLFDKATDRYTDRSINEAAGPFFKDVYPKIDLLNARFNSYAQLNAEYNQFPSKFVDFVPSIRFERRILMGLLLCKYFEPHTYDSRKAAYLQRFEQFDPFEREQQRNTIEEGIKVLDDIDFKAAKLVIAGGS